MLHSLLSFDRNVFYFINHSLANPVFDFIMPIIRNKFTWIPFYIFLIIFCIVKYKINGIYILLILIASVGLSDLISAHMIKPFFHRLRPCNDQAEAAYIIDRITCGSGFSFVSSHAANHFTIAAFIMSLFGQRWKWVKPLAFIWAFLICVAQVYVGVHFPLEVLAGGLIGFGIGTIMAKLTKVFNLDPINKPSNLSAYQGIDSIA